MVSHHIIDMPYRNAQSAKAINLHAVNLHIVMRCGIYIDACMVALYRIKYGNYSHSLVIYMSSLVIAKTALTSAEILHNRMGVI